MVGRLRFKCPPSEWKHVHHRVEYAAWGGGVMYRWPAGRFCPFDRLCVVTGHGADMSPLAFGSAGRALGQKRWLCLAVILGFFQGGDAWRLPSGVLHHLI